MCVVSQRARWPKNDLGCDHHAAGRVDRQLYGRAARQGDPGDVRPWASLDDELAVRFIAPPVRRLLQKAVTGRWRGAEAATRLMLRLAQHRAERLAARQRLNVLRRDQWLHDSLGAGSERRTGR